MWETPCWGDSRHRSEAFQPQPHWNRIGTAWKSVVWLNEMMELPLPCSITSDRFCMFFFPLILQLEATKMLMFSEQTWDLFKTKDQGRGQISWSAFGRPGMFQVVWALDDRWWSLMIVDDRWSGGSKWTILEVYDYSCRTPFREEQRTGADAFFAKTGKCSKTGHKSHKLYPLFVRRPLVEGFGIKRVSTANTFENVWKSLLSLRLRSLTTWFMDLISDFFSGPHCWYAVYASVQRSWDGEFGTVTCAEVPIYTHVAQAPGNPRRWTPFFFGYLTHFDATFREISEPEKEHVLALKVWNSEGAISIPLVGFTFGLSHRNIRWICQLQGPGPWVWGILGSPLFSLHPSTATWDTTWRRAHSSVLHALIFPEINGYGMIRRFCRWFQRWFHKMKMPIVGFRFLHIRVRLVSSNLQSKN